MSVDGVWSSEIAGAYGWEHIGVVFLKKGRLLGGGAHHYAQGRYKQKKDGTIVLKAKVRQFGKKRPLFGQQEEVLTLEARLKRHGNKMEGEAFVPGMEGPGILLRYKKRGKLPK